ncbi:type II RES/Xre toxin-antitoxin system antitoxin [Salinibacter ruber]|uniref:Toxin-antitoxin system antitoxin component (TIGR02293 family) n=2 Tax=Salinibacter ruber TaxID=146919 RepID=A0A9X2V881_9BACT|nr:antitoxin Xre-like helix-turn-helix domain-containing protein [Salinibacter ruber]MCS4122660.1 putative toxin-antitoxin system antitoxin component (TIGR02293 family) [Salinibacter ruber]
MKAVSLDGLLPAVKGGAGNSIDGISVVATRHVTPGHLSQNAMAVPAQRSTETISLPSYLPASEEPATETVEAIREGLPAEVLGWLKERLGLTAEELAGVIHISRRTMSRRKKEGRLKPDESERAVRLIRLYRRAAEVLGGPEEATEWLREENFALGGETPLGFADTEPGARRVERLLGQIEHGIPT